MTYGIAHCDLSWSIQVKYIREVYLLRNVYWEEIYNYTTSNNPYNAFLLTVMSGLSQLERDLISQRTKEGLVSAKARGRNGGRPSKQNEKGEVVKALANSGMKIVDIVKETGLSRSTVNRILRDNK